jgi:trimeric autotransporter adhesin
VVVLGQVSLIAAPGESVSTRPHLAHVDSGLADAQWDYRFALPGVQGNVMSMSFDGNRVYVGGGLQSVGREVVDGVAEFDGKTWRALPNGPEVNPSHFNVLASEVFRKNLYVGGLFMTVGGQPAGGLASWRDNEWTVFGTTNDAIYDLGKGRRGLLVAGRFAVPGVTNPVGLAVFDGHQGWEALNSELPPPTEEDIVALEAIEQVEILSDREIFALISFRIREWWGGWTPPFYYLMLRCDRHNNWSSLSPPSGDSADLEPYVFTRYKNQLVAGGDFFNPSNPDLRNIAVWNGSDWEALGPGLEGEVRAVAANSRSLYALHGYTDDAGFPRGAVSEWDGKRWKTLGRIHDTGFSFGRLFLSPKGGLYLTGQFSGVDEVTSPGLILWDGRQWTSLFHGAYEGVAGLVSTVAAFAEHRGEVYMGGVFLTAGSSMNPGLARWDGTRWHDVGGSILGWPPRGRSLVSSGDHLYVGGTFTNIGGVSVNNVARWDGTRWEGLGAGTDGLAATMAWWQNALYVGGRFAEAGSIPASNVAMWDGTVWQPLGDGCNDDVSALAVWNDNLYVGGRFTLAGGSPASLLARWDGASWQEVGGGLSGSSDGLGPNVAAIAAADDDLYVGGRFTSAGGLPAANIARWDGSNWFALSDGFPGVVSSLAVHNGIIYVGGRLNREPGQLVDAVLRWDGANWTTLGSGVKDPRVPPQVNALLARDDDLWVGGRFVWAGGKPSGNVARWIMHPSLSVTLKRHGPPHRPLLRVFGDLGLRFRLEDSADLKTWRALDSGGDQSLEIPIETQGASPARFFRAVAKP